MIAITGMGAVTPYGIGVEKLWDALLRGESALSEMDLFDLQGIACVQAGVCRFLSREDSAPRALRLAELACREALGGATPCDDLALCTASNFTSAAETFSHDLDSDVRSLAETFGAKGIRIPVSLSCASGAAALAFAAQLIENGRIRRALVAGYDAISPFSWSGLCSLRTMTKEKIRPFDRNRNGTVFSEGAAAILIESKEAAEERGAQVLAWLSGWGTGNNGHHLTAPSPRGAGSRFVMESALRKAGLKPEDIGCIQAHGTGTKANDLTESQAIHDLFGEAASHVPVTAIKGALGHLMGASSSAEIIAAVLSLRRQLIPPTVNCEDPDPECGLNVVRGEPLAVTAGLDTVLCNAAGFGGCNAAVVVSRDPVSTAAPLADAPIPILGVGTLCALGCDPEEVAACWEEGEATGEFTIPEYALEEMNVSPKAYVDPASQHFLAACAQTGVGDDRSIPTGVISGTAHGCAKTAEMFFDDYKRKGPRFVRPFIFPHSYSNTPASLAAMEWELTGPHFHFSGGSCASGLALVAAFDCLRKDWNAQILVGGSDAEPTGESASALLLAARAADTQSPVGWILGCGIGTTAEEALTQLRTRCPETAPCERLDAVKVAELCGNVGGNETLLGVALSLQMPGTHLVVTEDHGTAVAVAVKTVRAADAD